MGNLEQIFHFIKLNPYLTHVRYVAFIKTKALISAQSAPDMHLGQTGFPDLRGFIIVAIHSYILVRQVANLSLKILPKRLPFPVTLQGLSSQAIMLSLASYFFS